MKQFNRIGITNFDRSRRYVNTCSFNAFPNCRNTDNLILRVLGRKKKLTFNSIATLGLWLVNNLLSVGNTNYLHCLLHQILHLKVFIHGVPRTGGRNYRSPISSQPNITGLRCNSKRWAPGRINPSTIMIINDRCLKIAAFRGEFKRHSHIGCQRALAAWASRFRVHCQRSPLHVSRGEPLQRRNLLKHY